MTQTLPRVTYSNIGVDFTPVHDHLDTLIPDFEAQALGRTWQTPFATAPAVNGGVKTGHGAEQKSATVAPA